MAKKGKKNKKDETGKQKTPETAAGSRTVPEHKLLKKHAGHENLLGVGLAFVPVLFVLLAINAFHVDDRIRLRGTAGADHAGRDE